MTTGSPFLKHTENWLEFQYPSVTTDFSYENEEAYNYLKSDEHKPYIKHQTSDLWEMKKRILKRISAKGRICDMMSETNTDTCHAQKTFYSLYAKKQKNKTITKP